MAATRHSTFQATHANFATLVLENSDKGPVMVHYWAPWAGPCLMLKPVLARLVQEYAGRFLLVEINTDEEKALVKAQGVTSIPYLQIFRHGKPVETFRGGQPEADLCGVLDKYTGAGADSLRADAIRRYRQGDVDGALARLARAAAHATGEVRAHMDQAKILLAQGRAREARDVLTQLPSNTRAQAPVARLLAHARFAIAAQDAPEPAALERIVAERPNDAATRFQLSAVRLFEDDYDSAMAQLLEILRCEPEFRDGAARAGLLAVFDLLGEDDERVQRYRSLMAELND